MLLVELDQFTVLQARDRRIAAPFGVGWTELPVLKYLRSLKGDGGIVDPFPTQSEVSLELVRARFLQVVELEAAWFVGATLYAYHDCTGRDIVRGEELLSGLEE